MKMSAFPGVFNIIIFTNILYYTCVVNMYSSVHPTFYEENLFIRRVCLPPSNSVSKKISIFFLAVS